MHTASCDRCGDPAPVPLLRRVELSVDGDRVDGQTLCPDCFSQWISRYQDEMDNNLPEPESATTDAGDDITIAEETEPTPDIGTGSNVLDQTVASAETRAERNAQSNARGQRSDLASHPIDDGDDIREVGGEAPQGPGAGDGEVEVDLDDNSEYDDEDEAEEEEDHGGLF